MPGSRLNDTEKKLKKWWDSRSTQFTYPILKGISIHGSPGLRGITDLDISFNYPITVICGQNGCGKTTLLSLSALAFHSPSEHHCFQARNYKKNIEKSYYTFVDFFFKAAKDLNITGVQIQWSYEGGGLSERRKTKSIRKQSNKWMKYNTRPERPVHYFGVSRVIPAIEKNVLRGHFRVANSQHMDYNLNEHFMQIFCSILGRSYSNATVTQSEKYSIGSCEYGTNYTSFNMGAGEDILLELLYYLQETPNGSLIVIEEADLGLHPEAQKKFAEELIQITWDKKLQVIVSSHSPTFIDRVPRIARTLIQRTGCESHNIVTTPTTRYAMGFLNGDTRYELKVYCEDSFAERIIKNLLNGELRKRVDVIGVGSKEQVAKQCASHDLGNWKGKYLGVFDGDVDENQIRQLKDRHSPTEGEKIKLTSLPGDSLPPEKWVLKTIIEDKTRLGLLKEELREEDIEMVRADLDKMNVIGDHHDLGYEYASLTGLEQEEAENVLIKIACRNNSELEYLVRKIRKILDGNLH